MPFSSSMPAHPGMTAPRAPAVRSARRAVSPAIRVEDSGAPRQRMEASAAAAPLRPLPVSSIHTAPTAAQPSNTRARVCTFFSPARGPKLCSKKLPSPSIGLLSRIQGSFSSRVGARVRIRSLSWAR